MPHPGGAALLGLVMIKKIRDVMATCELIVPPLRYSFLPHSRLSGAAFKAVVRFGIFINLEGLLIFTKTLLAASVEEAMQHALSAIIIYNKNHNPAQQIYIELALIWHAEQI